MQKLSTFVSKFELKWTAEWLKLKNNDFRKNAQQTLKNYCNLNFICQKQKPWVVGIFEIYRILNLNRINPNFNWN